MAECTHNSIDECTFAEQILHRVICHCGNDTFFYIENIHYGDRICTKCHSTKRHIPLNPKSRGQ